MLKEQTTPLQDASLGHQRVLVVEDSYLVAQYLISTLRREGAEVMGPARCAGDAHWLLEIEAPTLAVLDVGLPDGDATSVADRLGELGVPFCFFTGQDGQFPEALAGIAPVVSKMDADALVPTLIDLLTVPSAAQEPA